MCRWSRIICPFFFDVSLHEKGKKTQFGECLFNFFRHTASRTRLQWPCSPKRDHFKPGNKFATHIPTYANAQIIVNKRTQILIHSSSPSRSHRTRCWTAWTRGCTRRPCLSLLPPSTCWSTLPTSPTTRFRST